MSSTAWNNYRPSGRRSIDNDSEIIESVPTFLKNTSLRFLQIVYSQRAKGELQYLHGDEDGTEIRIADQNSYQQDSNDLKPAIVAVRGSIQWGNTVIGSAQETNFRTGSQTHTDLLNGSIGFGCLSRVGLEAESIASDVFNLFKSFKTTLMKYGFFTVRSMSIGPEQLIEAPGEPTLTMVSVLIQCQVQDRWILEPKTAAELRKVVLSTFSDNTKVSETSLEGGSE